MASRPTVVLVHPAIPHNTGAVGRTCVALDMELVLIRPYGFTLSDKQLKRAGLDYWQHVRLAEFSDWDAFLADRQPPARRADVPVRG
jgi:tRNA (cytidine/uridine-2'-O-)-methyltransferase